MVLTRSAAKAAARAASARSHNTRNSGSGSPSNTGGEDQSQPDSTTPVRSLLFTETDLASPATVEAETRTERLTGLDADAGKGAVDISDLADTMDVDSENDAPVTEEGDEPDELDMETTDKIRIPLTDSVSNVDPVAVAVAVATATTGAINPNEGALDNLPTPFSVNPNPPPTVGVDQSLNPTHEPPNPFHSSALRRRSDAATEATNLNDSNDFPRDPEGKDTAHQFHHSIASLPSSSALSSLLSKRLMIGHFVALVAVTTAAHAAYRPASDPLVFSSILLLLCIIPMRFVLSFASSQKLGQDSRTPSPVFISLALNGAPVFASNALHFLAIRANPATRNLYLAATVLQVCAAWLVMIVTAGSFSSTVQVTFARDAAPLVFAIIETAADIYLAAVVTRVNTTPSHFPLVLISRGAVDTFRILRAAIAIVTTDTRSPLVRENSSVTKDTEA